MQNLTSLCWGNDCPPPGGRGDTGLREGLTWASDPGSATPRYIALDKWLNIVSHANVCQPSELSPPGKHCMFLILALSSCSRHICI